MNIQVRDGLPYVTVTLLYGGRQLELANVLLDTGSAGTLLAADADAAQWDERIEGAGNYRIVEVEFSTSVAENLLRWEQLDGIGPARYGELHQLQDAVVRLWRS
jgi:hypothetical protein